MTVTEDEKKEIIEKDNICEKIKSKVKEKNMSDKKLIKENKLYDAAYELFTTKGFQDTAIDDIVKKAGVGKGTFYLYFKDKYDIINRIILKKSSWLLRKAIQASKEKQFNDFSDEIIYFTDYVIEYFKGNRIILKLINKNFSWGMYRRALVEQNQYEEMKELVQVFIEKIEDSDLDIDDPEKTLFIVIELIGSVCYSSIILEEPSNIDSMKPVLFKTIRKILSK